ncbi:MAG: amidase [Acidimicrobiales bacterium]
MTNAMDLDATGQAALVRSGEVSSAELVEDAIARIERLNPKLNAVITPLYDKARRAVPADGPFSGVPMVLKDLACHSAGDPMYEGMRFLRDAAWVDRHDSHLATAFRDAGFIVMGKTNTPELGILPTTEPLAFGPTRNPWNERHSTGGSSGGSAAAVASGMVAVGHANDGGGSIRIPASECGLVGLKPTRGRTSTGPEYGDLMGGLVCEHVVTRSVRDTAAVLDAVAGYRLGDPYAAVGPGGPWLRHSQTRPQGLHIGLMVRSPGNAVPVHAECVAAVEATGRLLESLGHHVELGHPDAIDDDAHTAHFINCWAAGNAWAVDYWSRKVGRPVQPDDLEPLTSALVEMGRALSAPQWLTSREWLQANSRRLLGWWAGGFDLLVTPTIAVPPPELGYFDSPADKPIAGLVAAARVVPFTPPFNTSGQPGISLPLWWSESELPVGVQFVAAMGREDVLIAIAAQLEEAQPWAHRRPPIHAFSA